VLTIFIQTTDFRSLIRLHYSFYRERIFLLFPVFKFYNVSAVIYYL
jgi:hypothetical protein